MCEEMQKFRTILDNHNIKYIDQSYYLMSPDNQIDRTHFYINDIFFSVINGFGTYGGFIFLDPLENIGLLELYAEKYQEEPVGYLTAIECWDMIQKILNKDRD